MIVKRLVPVHTQLDYADSRLKLMQDSSERYRLLDKKKTQDAMHATHLIADDFNALLGERQDVALLHDLRIAVPGGLLHIDHLFITDNFHVYIVESRTAASKITLYSKHQFTSTDEHAQACAIPSPIEQLKKNSSILKRLLRQLDLPTRFGRELQPTFHKFVLIDAQAELSNKLGLGYEYFLSPPQLMSLIYQQVRKKSLMSLIGRMPADELRRISRQIAKMHAPKKIRFSNKFRHVVLPSFENTLH